MTSTAAALRENCTSCLSERAEVGLGPRLSRLYTEEASEQWKATSGGGRGGKGPAQVEQPSGGCGPDTEPGICVDPIGGCAPGDERVQTVHCLTFDPREEPGALAANAGICAGARVMPFAFRSHAFFRFLSVLALASFVAGPALAKGVLDQDALCEEASAHRGSAQFHYWQRRSASPG